MDTKDGGFTGGSVVVHFQTGGVARGDSGLIWREKLPEIGDVSVCFRLKLLQTRETNYVISYASKASGNDIFVGTLSPKILNFFSLHRPYETEFFTTTRSSLGTPSAFSPPVLFFDGLHDDLLYYLELAVLC